MNSAATYIALFEVALVHVARISPPQHCKYWPTPVAAARMAAHCFR